MSAIPERIDRLEIALEDFAIDVRRGFKEVRESQLRTEREMRAFKDEMRAFKDEMRAFKDEMRAFKDEMRAFKDEMQDFKDEMRAFKDEMRQQNREMNRQWGDVSNKLGTMVEDLVYPSLERIVKERLDREVSDLTIRHKRRSPDGRRVKEFDAITVAADLVCVNSTKATLRSADVDALVADIPVFREFFPEYAHLPAVGILATLAVDEGVLNYAEKIGFLVLAVGDELMEVKNRPGFEPKLWRGST